MRRPSRLRRSTAPRPHKTSPSLPYAHVRSSSPSFRPAFPRRPSRDRADSSRRCVHLIRRRLLSTECSTGKDPAGNHGLARLQARHVIAGWTRDPPSPWLLHVNRGSSSGRPESVVEQHDRLALTVNLVIEPQVIYFLERHAMLLPPGRASLRRLGVQVVKKDFIPWNVSTSRSMKSWATTTLSGN